MATATRSGPGAMHSAGIFSDMTVDGPEIGTLVVIVDRAKNLPNRKSMGKQDPYCAARLGKTAKKTDTDKRGGQTPRWDQELRFNVHDSGDYYQLKVSVFNDDKKTDLIGETWVPLQNVVVPGGGQVDTWHNLQYRGKYAGEVRMEITYYDSREKPVKAVEKVKQSTSGGAENSRESSSGSLAGPRQPKAAVKRRPLPADPTGASTSSSATSERIQTPPRGFQAPEKFISTQSPLQNIEYNTPLPQHHAESRQRYSEPRRHEPRPQQPPQVSSHASQSHGPPPGMVAYAPAPQPVHGDRYEIYDPQQGSDYIPGNILGRYEEPVAYERNLPAMPQEIQYSTYDAQPYDTYNAPQSPAGPPPPPPVHRSHHASPAVPVLPASNSYNDIPFQNSRFDMVRQDHYRNSLPGYSQPKSYEAYTPSKQDNLPAYGQSSAFQESPPRHGSYDDGHSALYESMQPYVEDAPSSPSPFAASITHTPEYDSRPHYDDTSNEKVPSPAPLNLSGRGSALSEHQSAAPSHSSYNSQPSAASPFSYVDQPHRNADTSPRPSYSQPSQPSQYSQHSQSSQYDDQARQRGYSQQSSQDRQLDDNSLALNTYVPPLPPTLVAGMDPLISQEINQRIYNDTRNTYSPYVATPPKGNYEERQQQRQPYSHAYSRSDAPITYAPATTSMSPYDTHGSSVSNEAYALVTTRPRAISPHRTSGSAPRRAVSPNPAPGSIPRKSVSPSPMHTEQRRLSGVPFGPDAFDILNPSVTPTKPVESHSSYSTPTQVPDPEAKIIMYDGREVDPSDHLPEHSWAPEPEVRAPKKTPDANRNARPSPAGAQPMPASGRRQLRIAPAPGRPHSMAAAPAYTSPYMSSGAGGTSESSSPTPAGRTRLQKKSNRPVPGGMSSPLASISPYQDSAFNARGLPRSRTMDFAGENGYSTGSPGAYRPGSGPAIPAKVPMQNYGPPPPPPEESAWALLEEMKSIDLGNGKARRKRFG